MCMHRVMLKLEINGFQISAMLEAFRTIYSVSETDKTDEIGLVYGLTDSVSEDEMIVEGSNTTVHSYAATPLGETGKKYSSLDNAKKLLSYNGIYKKCRVL